MLHLEQLLASTPVQIPPADADALRGILTSTLSTGRGGELYAASADVRRASINECISSTVNSYPQGPYQTELQREVKLSGFRSAISTVLTAPLYTTAWTPQLESQASSLSEGLGRVAEEKYPDIANSAVAEALRQRLRSTVTAYHEDQLTPAFKYAMPAQDFEQALTEARQLGTESIPFGLFENGHFLPEWETMTEAARSVYLTENAESLAVSIEASLTGAFFSVVRKSGEIALSKNNTPFESLLTPAEHERLQELSKKAALELAEISTNIVLEDAKRSAEERAQHVSAEREKEKTKAVCFDETDVVDSMLVTSADTKEKVQKEPMASVLSAGEPSVHHQAPVTADASPSRRVFFIVSAIAVSAMLAAASVCLYSRLF